MSVATVAQVEAFLADDQWTESLRGVLSEIATTGVLRYPWRLLCPLFCSQMERLLVDFAQHDNASVEPVLKRLSAALKSFSAPPFTVQRLAEVLLEPRKQYSRLEKVTDALQQLVAVTTTIPLTEDPPPLPSLASLPEVNVNPPSVTFRHMASSEVFRGFLEEKKLPATNGTTPRETPSLVAHVVTTTDEIMPPPQAESTE